MGPHGRLRRLQATLLAAAWASLVVVLTPHHLAHEHVDSVLTAGATLDHHHDDGHAPHFADDHRFESVRAPAEAPWLPPAGLATVPIRVDETPVARAPADPPAPTPPRLGPPEPAGPRGPPSS